MPRIDAGSVSSGRRGGARTPRTPSASGTAERASGRFLLYVEGPRDRDILRVWSRRVAPRLTRIFDDRAVILGGRRPARAVEHFRDSGGQEAGLRGLVVLDRDHHVETDDGLLAGAGLDIHTWGRRHIESYVLVPTAIRRLVGASADSPRLERIIEEHFPEEGDEAAYRKINAKRLLGNKGPLAQGLGRVLTPGALARSMRAEELHPDVVSLYRRIQSGVGETERDLEVIRRPPAL